MSSKTLARKLADVKPGTIFVGVDLGLDSNTAVAITERAERLARFTFPNDRDGYDYFYRRLTALQEQNLAPGVLVGMEPTNYFWKLLVTDLEPRHIPYRLINPYTVKKHREGDQLSCSKDDNRDAFTIADLLRTGKFTLTRLLHGDYAELRQAATLYSRLQRDIRRQKNIVHTSAVQLFPELGRFFADLSGDTAKAMLRNHGSAAAISCLDQEAFIAAVRSDFHGQRLRVSKLRRLHSFACSSIGVRHGLHALQLALRMHIDTLSSLQRHLEQARTALVDTFLVLPEARHMLSMPNLGLITAALILSEIGDPANFSNPQQLIKLAGTQPVPNTSGRKSRSLTPMSHKGRPRLRTCLYFAVMRLIPCDPVFTREYDRLQTREKNSLAKMQAIGVLMNKLLRIQWSLMHNRTYYNPDCQIST
jgi:transposase